jgi:hypothetical protein
MPIARIGKIVEAAEGVKLETPKGPVTLPPKGDFLHFTK